MRVGSAHPGFLPLPPVCNIYIFYSFFLFLLDCIVLVVCLLTAYFLPKASAPAVTNAAESGWQGMHVPLSKANESHFLISPLLVGLGCNNPQRADLCSLIMICLTLISTGTGN